MSRQSSDKTMLARLKRETKELVRRHEEAMEHANQYRIRATKAEQEAAEWKARFDTLLKVTGSKRMPHPQEGLPIGQQYVMTAERQP